MSVMIEERFDLESVKQLSAIFNKARPDGVPRVLFNYTRRGALKYLIGPDGDISCAHSLWQNDPARESSQGARSKVGAKVRSSCKRGCRGRSEGGIGGG